MFFVGRSRWYFVTAVYSKLNFCNKIKQQPWNSAVFFIRQLTVTNVSQIRLRARGRLWTSLWTWSPKAAYVRLPLPCASDPFLNTTRPDCGNFKYFTIALFFKEDKGILKTQILKTSGYWKNSFLKISIYF